MSDPPRTTLGTKPAPRGVSVSQTPEHQPSARTWLLWLAILVIVSANAVAITFGGPRPAVPEVDSKADAADHSPVPVGSCDVLHGVPEVVVTPAFGKVSPDGEPRSSRATQ